MPKKSFVGNDKLSIWNAVKHTDPKYVKEVPMGRRTFSAIDGQYQIEQATILWGPYGSTWGMRDLKFETVEVPGMSRDGAYKQTRVTLHCVFFYPRQSEECSFEIINDIEWKGDDTLKRLQTNTRSKALSWLGFGNDVFSNKHADQLFVKDLETRFGEDNAAFVNILSKIRVAKTKKQLSAYKGRLTQMIAEQTLSVLNGEQLLAACDDRLAEIDE